MIIKEKGVFRIAGWEEYQNVEGMEKIKEQNRVRKQRQRVKKEISDDVSRDTSRDKSRDGHKEEKVPQKEENKEGEEEIDNSSNSSSGSERACARYDPHYNPFNKMFEPVFTNFFLEKFDRYPTVSEKKDAREMMGKSKEDKLSDDELFLLNVAFESALKANVHEVYYLQGCFKNFEKQGIKTRQQYEEAVEALKAKREAKKQAAKSAKGEASYGDSEDFYQAALRAGGGV